MLKLPPDIQQSLIRMGDLSAPREVTERRRRTLLSSRQDRKGTLPPSPGEPSLSLIEESDGLSSYQDILGSEILKQEVVQFTGGTSLFLIIEAKLFAHKKIKGKLKTVNIFEFQKIKDKIQSTL